MADERNRREKFNRLVGIVSGYSLASVGLAVELTAISLFVYDAFTGQSLGLRSLGEIGLGFGGYFGMESGLKTIKYYKGSKKPHPMRLD